MMNVRTKSYLILVLICFCSCKEKPSTTNNKTTVVGESLEVSYATGFEIARLQDKSGYQLTLKNPFPGDSSVTRYLLMNPEKNNQHTTGIDLKNDTVVSIPIDKLVATSTTHIPPLVLLRKARSLVGFPDTSYISAPEVRSLIDDGSIIDLGANESINVERTISMQPDLVMGFAVDGEQASLNQIKRAGIPVLLNGDWTENHPLGRAEWIKVFGVLLGKEKEAFQIFNQIESDYNTAKNLAKSLQKPKVMAGAAWKNTWYLPHGSSWQGQLIADAGGDYLYKNTTGSGSLAYDIETVIQSSLKVDYWIAPGQYTSYQAMEADNSSYALFEPFKKKQVYTFALNKGAGGGVLYYEEASMRPDIVLKDLIQILHPGAINHELYFFDPLAP